MFLTSDRVGGNFLHVNGRVLWPLGIWPLGNGGLFAMWIDVG